jgi:hypothetical protein
MSREAVASSYHTSMISSILAGGSEVMQSALDLFLRRLIAVGRLTAHGPVFDPFECRRVGGLRS